MRNCQYASGTRIALRPYLLNGNTQGNAHSDLILLVSIPMSGLTKRFLLKLEVDQSPSSLAPKGSHWSNRDIDPVPPEQRTWKMIDYFTYWISDAFNVATWEIASSILALGLSWKDAIPIIIVGYGILMLFVVLNGVTGARLHIPFPVLNRSSMGFYLSYWSIFSRAVLACFWMGIQGANGGECVTQMLRAIWPSYRNIPNHLPPNAGITTQGMLSYFLFWIIQLPFLLLRPHKLRYLFWAKAIIAPSCGLAMMIWAFVKTGGGPIFAQQGTLHGSARSWAWLSCMNSVFGNLATLAVSIPDFTRYARKPSDTYIQVVAIPIMLSLVGFFGIVVTSAGAVLYGGQLFWDPLRLIDNWTNRPATFFAAFSFALATIGTNISANSLSAANDFSALFPRYINLRRGSLLCAIIGGWVCVPWLVLANATTFLNFMSGYTVFIAPIIGIMVADYWVLHKQKVDVPSMYHPHGRYWYTWGINWRALVAMLLTVPPMIPGLAQAITPSLKTGNTIRLYDISFFFGCFAGAAIFLTLSYLFPAQETFVAKTISVLEADGASSKQITMDDKTSDEEYARE
ncbi:NCS1 nucleoside transporter family [Gautieria morchelliformis]|nr:NCS1 nucleoside transporter family [Gautieria morchelliformis]